MFEDSTLENIHIYLTNVSTYYILSIVISLLSVFITIYYKLRICVPMEEETEHTPIQFKTSDLTEGSLSNTKTEHTPIQFKTPKVTEGCLSNTETEDSPIIFKTSEVLSEEVTEGNSCNTETAEESEMDSMFLNMSPVMIKQFLKAKIPQKLLTEDQLSEEKRAEKAQLEAIFKILKEQESKFQMKSMEELHEQTSLYGI